MLIVVDVNVIISALVSKGHSLQVFEYNKVFGKLQFVAPEFAFIEIENNLEKVISLTKLSREEIEKSLYFIKEQISFVPYREFLDKLQEAKELNAKDAPYLALALKLKCPIFSGDKGLKKQDKVNIFSPRKLLTKILS